MIYEMHILLISLVVGAVSGFFATGLVRLLAIRVGFVARPNPLVPQHTTAVAYMGGVGIACGLLIASLILFLLDIEKTTSPMGIVVPAVAFLILGLIDDWRAMTQLQKLAGQIVIASYAVATMKIDGLFFGINFIDNTLAVIWILTLVNAANMTDVCDGLVGGVSAVSLIALSFLAPSVAEFNMIIAGACIGFLVWNKPPAKIYMGDAGSHFLGFIIAVGALIVLQGDPFKQAPIALLVSGVFIFELCLLILVRLKKGIPIWQGSTDHFSLRMQARGFSRWQTILFAWLAAAVMCSLALLWSSLATSVAWVLFIVMLFICIIVGVYFARWEVGSVKR